MFEKVLVPLDGSKLAEQVLPSATELAQQCQSSIVLLRLVPYSTAPTTATLAATESSMALEQEQAEVYLEWTAKALQAKGLEVECVVRVGSPADEIVNYAKQNGIDIIAISTHGRSGLDRLVFGSVADKVVRESGIPVLLIRPQLVPAEAAKRTF